MYRSARKNTVTISKKNKSQQPDEYYLDTFQKLLRKLRRIIGMTEKMIGFCFLIQMFELYTIMKGMSLPKTKFVPQISTHQGSIRGRIYFPVTLGVEPTACGHWQHEEHANSSPTGLPTLFFNMSNILTFLQPRNVGLFPSSLDYVTRN